MFIEKRLGLMRHIGNVRREKVMNGLSYSFRNLFSEISAVRDCASSLLREVEDLMLEEIPAEKRTTLYERNDRFSEEW